MEAINQERNQERNEEQERNPKRDDKVSADDRSGQESRIAQKPGTEPCGRCGADQSAIRINVDGNTLLMESCDSCDTRRWQLEGERIDLQEALTQVGEHSGRRRSKTR